MENKTLNPELSLPNDIPEGATFEYAWEITKDRGGLIVGTGTYDSIKGQVTGIAPDGKVEFLILSSDKGFATTINGESGWGYYYPEGKTHAFPEQSIRDMLAGKYAKSALMHRTMGPAILKKLEIPMK